MDADLIVIGPHRRQLRDLFAGTTAQRLIARIRRPILVAAGVPSRPYSHALVALNLEESSATAAKAVLDMGLVSGSSLLAMHAFDAPARAMMERAMADKDAIDQYVLDEEVRASHILQRFLVARGLGIARHKMMRLSGSPARTILKAAGDEDAALIVMGTSQRKGIERFILRSVAEDVLEDADRDILVVPAPAVDELPAGTMRSPPCFVTGSS